MVKITNVSDNIVIVAGEELQPGGSRMMVKSEFAKWRYANVVNVTHATLHLKTEPVSLKLNDVVLNPLEQIEKEL